MKRVFLISIPSAWILGIVSLSLSRFKNYSRNQIVLGNYPDYISSDLVKLAKNDYGMVMDNMNHDQVVKEKFKNEVYDAAIVSTSVLKELRDSDLLAEIDWSKLNIQKDNKSISSDKEAKDLFSDAVKNILHSDDDFLKYGIPYFFNKLTFCYSGEPIKNLQSKVSWTTLLSEIAVDGRFMSKDGIPKIGFIDDPRTILSLSRFAYDYSSTINPLNFEYKNSASFYSSYMNIVNRGINSSKMGKNFLLITSNSSSLVDSLVSGSIAGAFMYNGDCLYAAYGGNSSIDLGENKFHVVETDKDIYFLDFFVISNNISKNSDKLEKIHKFASKLMFDGYDKKDELFVNKSDYKYGIEKNFDFVKYTPVLKEVLSLAETKYLSGTNLNTKQKILKINKNNEGLVTNYYETFFDSKMKSDMLIAFEKFKLNI